MPIANRTPSIAETAAIIEMHYTSTGHLGAAAALVGRYGVQPGAAMHQVNRWQAENNPQRPTQQSKPPKAYASY